MVAIMGCESRLQASHPNSSPGHSCEGAVLWRGYFQGNNVTGLRLAINGGEGDPINISLTLANEIHSLCGKYILQRTLHSDDIRKVSRRMLVQVISIVTSNF